jgi:hypothetical protein
MNTFYEETSHEDVSESPQIIKPKKKLFVKTRTTSTRHNEKLGTPDRNNQLKVTFKMFELEPKDQKLDEIFKRSTSIIKIE